jgi:hypothetical protein
VTGSAGSDFFAEIRLKKKRSDDKPGRALDIKIRSYVLLLNKLALCLTGTVACNQEINS